MSKEIKTPLTPRETFFQAGQRAAQWYLDTDDCLFCNVDTAQELGHTHEHHCTFFGISDVALKEFIDSLPPIPECNRCRCGTPLPEVANHETPYQFCSEECKTADWMHFTKVIEDFEEVFKEK